MKLSKSPGALPRLWYVPDKRIRTEAAAVEAARLADHAGTGDADQAALFVAFHVCGYRATRARTPAESAVWRRRWARIRERLTEANMGLVGYCVRRLGGRHDIDDLASEGNKALADAVVRFDPFKGYRFSTYATHAIQRRLWEYHQRSERRRQRFPVALCEVPAKPVPEPDADIVLHVERLRHVLTCNLANLSRVEADVIRRRFPEGPAATYLEIGTAVGLSKERIRQIQNKALAKLRAALESDPVLSTGAGRRRCTR